MRNCPGISWGYEAPINLMETTIGYLAVHYDDFDSKPIVVQQFNPKNVVEHSEMMRKLTWFNYHTNRICPIVEADMGWIS